MNIKIKELIESMGIIPEDEHYDIAKAVIRECIAICIKVDDDDYEDFADDIATGIRDGALLCKFDIEEYFGIKE